MPPRRCFAKAIGRPCVLPCQDSVGAQHAAPAEAPPSLSTQAAPGFRSAGVSPALLIFLIAPPVLTILIDTGIFGATMFVLITGRRS
jgi:hypothetical protein